MAYHCSQQLCFMFAYYGQPYSDNYYYLTSCNNTYHYSQGQIKAI